MRGRTLLRMLHDMMELIRLLERIRRALALLAGGIIGLWIIIKAILFFTR